MVFRSKNKMFAVEITPEVQKEIEAHATISGRKETGGILIGKYKLNQSLAAITEITGPPPDSEQGFTWFKRGTKGLKKLINENWLKGCYYLGEWHFHPYASPIPSGQDIQQVKSIAMSKIYNCPEPILIILGGSPTNFTLRAFVPNGKRFLIELYPAILEK